MFDCIVWATDGSGGADGALAVAKGLAAPGGRIVAVHCTRMLTGRAMGQTADPKEPEVLDRIAEQVAALVDDGFDATVVTRRTQRQPADVIGGIAAEVGAELIVCGSRGHGALTGALVGSVSQRLAHVGRVPVLIVPTTVRTREAATAAAP